MSKRVLVPLGEGFEEIEAVSIIDVIRRGGIEVVIASLTNELKVTGAHKITVETDTTIKTIEADAIDMVVLPGGWGGTYKMAESSELTALLKEMNSKGKNIGAICAAPYVLKEAGILPDNYTCYPAANEKINGKNYTDKVQVVEDGNVMTSRGPGTAICFGLEIVKKLVGTEKYQQLKTAMLAEHCD